MKKYHQTLSARLVAVAVAAATAALEGSDRPADQKVSYVTVSGGAVSFQFDESALQVLNLRFIPQGQLEAEDNYVTFEIDPASTSVEIETVQGRFNRISVGAIRT